MAQTTPKQVNALVTYFLQKYKAHYKFDAVVNRNRARWRVEDMLQDMSYEDALGVIDYYFETLGTHNHEFDWLLYNYDKLVISKNKRDEDAVNLARLREESKRRTEEWRKRLDNDGTN